MSDNSSGTIAPPRGDAIAAIPWVLAGLLVLMQIAYPLTSNQVRTTLTIATVVVFVAASCSHALIVRGARWTALYLVITVVGGWLVEVLGSRTDVPFGPYDYTDSLGLKLLGVPVVIPFAWAMMAYPSLIVGRALTRSRIAQVLIGAWALASWDVFLDPMMVSDGHWVWQSTATAGVELPGVPGIPAQNFAGWLLVALVMMTALTSLGDGRRPRTGLWPDAQPLTLWMWTYLSSVLANAIFLGRPSVAITGAIVMGAVALPLGRRLWRARPRPSAVEPRRDLQ
ncbi:MAG TPA: carotenoid biosynthesis protein [Actinobacteria bacterium]|nr:carotenoid biosynthesis protein [Actinomycetota bacterium]